MLDFQGCFFKVLIHVPKHGDILLQIFSVRGIDQFQTSLEHYDDALQVGLHQNHPAYDKFIEYRLNRFMDKGNVSHEACNDYIQKQLIPELKKEIFNAKNSTSKNLNTYFRDVINPVYNIR